MTKNNNEHIDYKSMYYYLFNAVTDALNSTEPERMCEILIRAQQHTEEMYISE